MSLWLGVGIFAAGYAASVFTWPKVREFFNGVETEIQALEAKARALRDKIKDAL